MQKIFLILLIIILTIIIKLFPDDITRFIISIIFIFTVIIPISTIKQEKITIKSKGQKSIFFGKYNILETKDGKTFVNTNFFFPNKTHSDQLQKQFKIGETYIVRTHRPWLFSRYRNILSIQQKISSTKQKKKQ